MCRKMKWRYIYRYVIQRLRYRCVKEQQMLKNPPNFFTYKIKYHVYNQYCPLKYIITYILKISLGNPWQIPWTTSRRDDVRIGRGLPSVKIYIHPAETHRLLKFLFHIMGRLVPAHNKYVLRCQSELETSAGHRSPFGLNLW